MLTIIPLHKPIYVTTDTDCADSLGSHILLSTPRTPNTWLEEHMNC